MANLRPYALPTQGTRELPTAYDQTRVSPEAYGGGAGQALEQAGGAAAQYGAERVALAQKAKSEADASSVADIETETVKGIDYLLNDPEKGLMFQKGKAAQDYMQPTQEALQKLAAEQIGKAKNDEQRRVLTMRVQTLLADANRSIQKHVGQQLDVMEGQSFKDRIEAGLSAAANSWADPEARAQAIAKMQPFALIEARRQGLDDVSTQALWQNVQRVAAQRIAQQMLARNLGDAAQSFLASPLLPGQKQPVMELLGQDSAPLVHQASQMAAATAGLNAAVKVASEFRVRGTDLIDQGRAEKAYQDRYFGKVSADQYQHGLAMLREQISMGESAAQARNGRDYNVALSAFQSGGATALVTDPAASAAIARLRDPNNAGGASLYDALQKHQTNPPPTPENDAALGRARAAIVADEWQRYAQMSPDQVRAIWAPQVTRGQMEQISTLHAQAKERLLNKDKFGMPGVVDQEVVALGKKAGAWSDTDKKKWKDENWAAYNAISAEVDRRERDWWKDHNTPPAAEDYRKWIAPLLVKGTVTGGSSWFGDKSGVPKARALTDPQYQGKPFETEVPSKVKDQLREKFKARGVQNPTDAQIRAAYEATLAQR